MATPMISKQWADFVLPIIRKEWIEKMAEVKSPIAPFYGIETSTASVEYSQGIGSFDIVPEYNSASAEEPGNSIQYDSFKPLYEKTFTHKEYAKGVAIARKLWDDDQSGLIKRKAQTLGFAFGTTIATHQSSVLNNAFAAGYTGGDSKVLCATDHPTNDDDDGSYSNAGSTAFSYDAVVATLIAGTDLNDDRGNPMPIVYDTIVVPTALQATGFEIVKAVGKPGTANNDANYLTSAGLQLIVDPYLSDANNWFMLSSSLAKMHLLWFWRVRPELAKDPTSDYDLEARFRGYMRYSFGWDDSRFIYGHEVS